MVRPEWLTHVTSCWNAVIQCFQWFGTMLLPDTSFLLNVIIIHSVLQSMIRAYCCCCSTVELWFFFGQNKHFLYVQAPDYYYWMVQHPTDQYTHQKVQEIHSCMLLAFFFFVPSSCAFCNMTLSSFLPFVTHIRGHIARTPLPSPLPCLPSF